MLVSENVRHLVLGVIGDKPVSATGVFLLVKARLEQTPDGDPARAGLVRACRFDNVRRALTDLEERGEVVRLGVKRWRKRRQGESRTGPRR